MLVSLSSLLGWIGESKMWCKAADGLQSGHSTRTAGPGAAQRQQGGVCPPVGIFPFQISSALFTGLICTGGARAAMALPCVALLFDAEGSFPPQQELRHPKCSAQAGRGGRDEGLADTEPRARGENPCSPEPRMLLLAADVSAGPWGQRAAESNFPMGK